VAPRGATRTTQTLSSKNITD